jgi:site-specific DNA recombinase
LTEELHRQGLRNRRGGRLTRAGLWVVLTNPAYIGKIPWKGAIHEGTHDPIVPQNLFDRVQQVLASHGRSKERQRKHTHFLKGMLTCDLCGKRLLFNVVKNRKKQDFAYFACASHFKPGSKCEEPYLPTHEIERQVEQLYRKVDIPPELKRRIETMLEEEVAQLESNRADTTHFAARRLKRLAKEKERLLDLYLQEGIDRNTFMERKARIESEIFDLETKMGDQTETIQQARELISAAVKLARNCYAAYRKASPETKKIWNQALFAEIVIRDKKIRKVTYQEPFRTLLSLGGSNKTLLVGATGFEPVTPAL